MILFFSKLESEISIEFLDIILDLLIETTCLITIDLSKVGIKHNFHPTDGVYQVLDVGSSIYVDKFLHGCIKNKASITPFNM